MSVSSKSRNNNVMCLIEKDVTVAINGLEGQQILKTDIVGFIVTHPDNTLVKAFVVDQECIPSQNLIYQVTPFRDITRTDLILCQEERLIYCSV